MYLFCGIVAKRLWLLETLTTVMSLSAFEKINDSNAYSGHATLFINRTLQIRSFPLSLNNCNCIM